MQFTQFKNDTTQDILESYKDFNSRFRLYSGSIMNNISNITIFRQRNYLKANFSGKSN